MRSPRARSSNPSPTTIGQHHAQSDQVRVGLSESSDTLHQSVGIAEILLSSELLLVSVPPSLPVPQARSPERAR